MRILLAAGVIRSGVRYPAPMLPIEQAIDAHLGLISCENRKKVCGNDYSNATALRYYTRMENAYPTQDEFTAALEAKGFRYDAKAADAYTAEFEASRDRYSAFAERRDSAEEMPLGVPR